jgi:DNA-directed RNA polymerase specialized sigma24 family protein
MHLGTGETYINDICTNFISSKYLQEELEAETYLAIAEMPEDKLLFLFNHKQLRYYVYGMIRNQIRSKSSKFYRSHVRPQILEDEFESKHMKDTFNFNYNVQEQTEIIREAMETLDFYRKKLFEMYYFDDMSYMQISDYTASKNKFLRIPKPSIWNAVKSAREEVIEYIQKNYKDSFE